MMFKNNWFSGKLEQLLICQLLFGDNACKLLNDFIWIQKFTWIILYLFNSNLKIILLKKIVWKINLLFTRNINSARYSSIFDLLTLSWTSKFHYYFCFFSFSPDWFLLFGMVLSNDLPQQNIAICCSKIATCGH